MSAEPMAPVELYALLLADLGLGEYRPDSTGGSIHVLTPPPDEPHVSLTVAIYGGPAPDARHGYDEHDWQVRVRSGPGDGVAGARAAQRVYDTVLGLGRRLLADGVTELQPPVTGYGPVYLGQDERGAHDWTVNFGSELRRRTRNRT